VIAPDATLPLIEVTVREGVDSGPVRAKVVQRARVIFKEDSAAVDEVGDAGLTTRVFGTREGAMEGRVLGGRIPSQDVVIERQ
jgi:hypothetical protein